MRIFNRSILLVILGMSFTLAFLADAHEIARPLMKDFMGINGHYTFKPELYKQVCRLVRNYHNMDWDAKQPGDQPTFPICINGVNWKENVYKRWVQESFEIDLCAQFGRFGRENSDYKNLWIDKEKWAYTYGFEMAKYFGPSGEQKLCTSIEIGNEPGSSFDDDLYQRIFTQMAKGIREGDPKIKIITCTAQTQEADSYSKQLSVTFASDAMKQRFDAINLHVYAIKSKENAQHPWERSYPEDPGIDYLKNVDEAILWRDREAPDKEIWITEFGWDACTPQAMNNRKDWALQLHWTGQTDLQQAQYLVRSFFCFAERDVDRAYIYYYDDNDEPSVHAASGLTRHFEPKMSFWAVKQLYEMLGDYRFSRIISKVEGVSYVYEFANGADDSEWVWVAWTPTGDNRETEITLHALPGKIESIEGMVTQEGPAPTIVWKDGDSGNIQVVISESPIYIRMKK